MHKCMAAFRKARNIGHTLLLRPTKQCTYPPLGNMNVESYSKYGKIILAFPFLCGIKCKVGHYIQYILQLIDHIFLTIILLLPGQHCNTGYPAHPEFILVENLYGDCIFNYLIFIIIICSWDRF